MLITSSEEVVDMHAASAPPCIMKSSEDFKFFMPLHKLVDSKNSWRYVVLVSLNYIVGMYVLWMLGRGDCKMSSMMVGCV